MKRVLCAMSLAGLSFAGLCVLALPAAAQMQHPGMAMPAPPAKTKPAPSMGFDPAKTTHHFKLFEDGGVIELTANDPKDQGTVTGIRLHLHDIETKFGDGDFSSLTAMHGPNVPGIKELTKLQDVIIYAYISTDEGGILNIRTVNAEAVAAVHTFLESQIETHKTGDSTEVGKR